MNKKTTIVAFMIGTITLVSVLLATGSKQPRQHNAEGVGLDEERDTAPPVNPHSPINTHREEARVHTASQGMEGRVIDMRGKPEVGTEIIAMRSGMGAVLRTRPDEEGHFSFTDILAGEYIVFFKEKDGPINLDGLFMTGGTLPSADILSKVQVFEGQITSGIVIKAGPKWPKLTGYILDAETNEPIVDSRITLRRVDNPDYYLEFGPREEGKFTVAVPEVPITIEVSAAGYETWTYNKNGLANPPAPLKVSLGETKSLTVRLRH